MRTLQAIAILAVITLCSAFFTGPTHEAESSVASLNIVSLDEAQEITFEATLISYETDPTDRFNT